MERTILLADMNSFFASVDQALDPALRNRPVIVGESREKRHGIGLAASYEAKARGVKTGMTVKDSDFNWLGRSRTLKGYTDLPEDLYEAGTLACGLFRPGGRKKAPGF